MTGNELPVGIWSITFYLYLSQVGCILMIFCDFRSSNPKLRWLDWNISQWCNLHLICICLKFEILIITGNLHLILSDHVQGLWNANQQPNQHKAGAIKLYKIPFINFAGMGSPFLPCASSSWVSWNFVLVVSKSSRTAQVGRVCNKRGNLLGCHPIFCVWEFCFVGRTARENTLQCI